MGWEPVGNRVTLDPKPSINGDSVWSGEITVLPGIAGKKQRLVIEEFERHRTGASPVLVDRLVYSDVIEL